MERKEEMMGMMNCFKDMPGRLLKYIEILLEGKDATPECYQDTMSYRRLAVALTTRCNLSCKWCYRLDPRYKSILNKALDLNLYLKFIDNTQGHFRMVHLAGLGEPTLYRHFIDAIELSRRLSDYVKVTSNGTVLTPVKIERYIKAGLTHIEISVDAFDEKKLMEYRGVKLDKIRKIVRYISDSTNLFLQINSVVSKLNYCDLIDMVKVFGESKNIRIWHTIPLFKTKQMHEINNDALSQEEHRELLVSLAEAIEKEGLDWKLSPDVHEVKLDPIISMKKRRNICFTCFDDPYISVKGRLNYCSRQEYSSVVDISNGFERAWNHESMLAFRREMLRGGVS